MLLVKVVIVVNRSVCPCVRMVQYVCWLSFVLRADGVPFFSPLHHIAGEGRGHALLPPASCPNRRDQVRDRRQGVQPQALRRKPRAKKRRERRTFGRVCLFFCLLSWRYQRRLGFPCRRRLQERRTSQRMRLFPTPHPTTHPLTYPIIDQQTHGPCSLPMIVHLPDNPQTLRPPRCPSLHLPPTPSTLLTGLNYPRRPLGYLPTHSSTKTVKSQPLTNIFAPRRVPFRRCGDPMVYGIYSTAMHEKKKTPTSPDQISPSLTPSCSFCPVCQPSPYRHLLLLTNS